jgi:integrase
MGEKKRKRVDPTRWPGVYCYETGRQGTAKTDITYYIAYRDGRRKIWEKVGRKSEGVTPQIADDIRKERTLKARHGEAVLTAKQIKRNRALANKSLDAIAGVYFEQRKSAKWGQFDQYRYDKHVKPVIGHRPIASLTPLDMKRIEKAMEGAAPATVWGALELVRRIANYGKRNKLCAGLPFTIEMPKRDNQVVEYLTPDQAGRLLNTLDSGPSQDVANMLKMAMFAGLRRGEIFKLEDRDFDFANKLIRLRSPKGGKSVSVPLNPAVEQVVKDQVAWRNERHPGAPYLFPGQRGKQRVDCTAVDRIRAAADLPRRFRMFHGLRHHFAVTLANSGEFTLDMIGELLTHKSNDMTRRYAVYLPDNMRRASSRAAELLTRHASNGKSDANKEQTERAG